MCQRVTCNTCNRPTFAGCGMHIESVLRDVPKEQRCKCREEAQKGSQNSASSGGLLGKLFGR